MSPCSADLLRCYVLACYRLYDLGTGYVNDTDLVDHKYKVGERRAVNSSARARTGDYRELGDNAACLYVPEEDVSVSGESVYSLLDTGSA